MGLKKRYSEGFELPPVPVSDVVEVEVPAVSAVESGGLFAVFQYLSCEVVAGFLLDLPELHRGLNIVL